MRTKRTRRTRRTKRRHNKKGGTQKAKQKIILVPNGSKEDIRDEHILSNLISEEVPMALPPGKSASAQSARMVGNIIKNVFGSKKTYSPSVNEKLNLMSEGTVHNMFGCQEMDELMNDGMPTVKVNDICVHYIQKEAQELLLSNLEASRKVRCSKIITPRQAQTNCWFNTMFVMFFVSDKGRKFFKYFRAMMIMGVKGELIKSRGTIEEIDSLREKATSKDVLSRELHKSLFLLNLAIEACLTGNEYAYALNTNDLILEIHTAIANSPGGAKYVGDVFKPGQLGNPFTYYSAIMSFLSDGTIRILDLYLDRNDDNTYVERVKDDIASSLNKPPHIVMVTVIRGNNTGHLVHPKMYSVKGLQYSLDAALVLSDDRMHWTCLLTCNEQGYAYDGGSFTRLIPFDWIKNALNTSNEYRFKTYSDMTYTFDGPSQTLLYYRTK
jgi:hypothetical protein